MMAKLIFANPQGEIFDHPFLEMMGCEGSQTLQIPAEDLVPIPEGTKLFTMPGRLPVGWDPETGREVVLDRVEWKDESFVPQAVSGFLPPGYARTFLPATSAPECAPTLPLWAYAALGWKEGGFFGAGVRVDKTAHWDPENYDDRTLVPLVEKRLAGSENRLLHHLERCATEYHCLAAKNLFYGRWECPLPVSPVCNADCVGCLSLQPDGKVPASHERLNFLPAAGEILEIAVPHLESAEEAVVSFGQGCEGEPLLQANLIEEVIREIRRQTRKGIIHINTNGSKPELVQKLCEAGLDSMRTSLNSAQAKYYAAYYRPKGYSLEDVLKSVKIATDYGLFTSANLLTFPGFTDRREEVNHFLDFVKSTGLCMVQWKNLNMDPELYQKMIGISTDPVIGIRRAIAELRGNFPGLLIGYFNRPSQVIEAARRARPRG